MKPTKSQKENRYTYFLNEVYRLYEQGKKNPDPRMTYEAWVKHLAKELKI